MQLVVKSVKELTANIRLFELADEQGETLPKYTAGAHIDIDVDVDSGQTTTRSYSLINWSQPIDAPTSYCIAVQKEAQGEGGSAYMHTLSVGQTHWRHPNRIDGGNA